MFVQHRRPWQSLRLDSSKLLLLIGSFCATAPPVILVINKLSFLTNFFHESENKFQVNNNTPQPFIEARVQTYCLHRCCLGVFMFMPDHVLGPLAECAICPVYNTTTHMPSVGLGLFWHFQIHSPETLGS